MPTIRRSDRVPMPKFYWETPIKAHYRWQPPAFTIYAKYSKDLGAQPSGKPLGSLPEGVVNVRCLYAKYGTVGSYGVKSESIS